MKTPRDILLARHQNALPKLDAIRHSVVKELNNQGTKEQNFPAVLVASFLGGSHKIWQELVLPCRRTWAGLAAVWLVIGLVNVAPRDGTAPVVMAKSAANTTMAMNFYDQQKLLNELLASSAPTAAADRPRIYSPKPRTESLAVATA